MVVWKEGSLERRFFFCALGNLARYSSALENSLLTMFVEAVCRKFFYPKWEFFWFFCVGNGEKLLLFSFPRAIIVLCKRVKANLRGRRHEGYSCEEESSTYMSSS